MGSMKWYGELPERWDSRKMKFLFSERVEKGYQQEQLLVASQNMGVVPKGVYGNRTVEAIKDLHLLKLVCIGDFVISLRSFQGGLEYAYYKGIISPAYTVIVPTGDIQSRYFQYLAKSKPFISLLQTCVTGIREGQNIDYGRLREKHIPLPPSDEQAQIVRYLDWKVSSINKLINGKKKQIELLKEKRKTVINEEFQKVGRHNRDCIQRLKNKVSDINEKASPIDSFYIGMENIKSWLGQFIDTGSSAEGDCKKFQIDDILFGKLRPYLAKVYAPDRNGVCSGEFLVLRGYNGYLPYLKYLLLSTDFVMLVNASTYGAKMPRANWTFIGNCYLPFPSVEEQKDIVHKLDALCAEIDNLSTKLQQQIKLLEELRASLISDVVTGKIDVRGVVIPKYETVEEIWKMM
jgi:type I restriction enzyme S subunit